MNQLPIVLCYILLGILRSHPSVPCAALIDWMADRKLTWSDFKERPDKNSPNAALTSTAIKIDFDYSGATLHFHIRCQFDKSKSWGRVKTDYILSHEQGHFDITEIYARKLHKALTQYSPREGQIEQDVNKIYDQVLGELKQTQEAYDRESQFSMDPVRQKEWIKKIDVQLRELQRDGQYT